MNVRYRVELGQAERAELTTLLSRGKRSCPTSFVLARFRSLAAKTQGIRYPMILPG